MFLYQSQQSQLHIPFPDSPDTSRRKQAEQASAEDSKPKNPQLERLKEQSHGSLNISSSRSTLGSAASSKSEQGSQASLLSEKPSESTSKAKVKFSYLMLTTPAHYHAAFQIASEHCPCSFITKMHEDLGICELSCLLLSGS